MARSNTTPTLDELIDFGIVQALGDVHVAFPALVLSYVPTNQFANVQPTVRIYQRDSALELDVPFALPALTDCPVLFPGSTLFSITWPLAPLDEGLVICCSHDLDAWLTAGTPDTIPTSRRRHDLSDAVFWPGIRPKTKPRSQPSAGASGIAIGLDTGLSELRATAAEIVVKGPTVKLGSELASIAVALSASIDSHFTALQSYLDGHIHPAGALLDSNGLPCTGATASPGSSSPVPPSTVGSAKIFGE